MSTVFFVRKHKPRTAPHLAAGVKVTIRERGHLFGRVGEVAMRSHSGWFVGVDRLLLNFKADQLEAVPFGNRESSGVGSTGSEL